MRAKIGYMEGKIRMGDGADEYERKYRECVEKIAKVEKIVGKGRGKKGEVGGGDRGLLVGECAGLEGRIGVNRRLLESLRENFNRNLDAKNKVLMIRIE